MNHHIDDILYERPAKLKLFVSSQMRGNVLNNERKTAARAIEKTGFAFAWLWENDACAGPYSSEAICLGHARTSDGLILILAKQLTPITRKEYEVADVAGIPCYIFLKEAVQRDGITDQFIKNVRANATTTVNFKNLSELETQVIRALFRYIVDSYRERMLKTKTTRSSTMRKGLTKIKDIIDSSDGKKS